MRKRAPRTKVLIAARMRMGRDWSNVSIRNISPQGMMLWSDAPPAPGSYAEICGSATALAVRVVWVKDGYFGVRAQDRIDVDSAVRGGNWRPSDPHPLPRHPAHNPAMAHAASRQFGTGLQFAAVAFAVVGGAAMLALMLHAVLTDSLGAIASALAESVG